MSEANDVWFVRFPDGQILRAQSTESVRHHLETGRIPRTSWVRRTPEEEWVTLEWVAEFSDLAGEEQPRRRDQPVRPERPRDVAPPPAASPGAGGRREDRMRLVPAVEHGLLEALFKALDSCLTRGKLGLACLATLAGAVLVSLVQILTTEMDFPSPAQPWLGAGLIFLVVWSLATALITQITYVELSQARRARRAEATRALLPNLLRLVVAILATVGVLVFLLWAADQLPDWLFPDDEEDRMAVAGAMAIVETLLAVLLGVVLTFVPLLAPIIVVEECSAPRALVQWWRFLREHCRRLFVYEGLTLALAAAASLPLLLPVHWAAPQLLTDPGGPGGDWEEVMVVTSNVLYGLALTPLFAYVVVANVFLYLHLRYEPKPRRRA
jgi:hypothetical protein